MNHSTRKVIELFIRLTEDQSHSTNSPEEVYKLIEKEINLLQVTDGNFDWAEADWPLVENVIRNRIQELATENPNPFYQLILSQIIASQN